MPKDDTAPASQQDLRDFLERLSKQIDVLYEAAERSKDEILQANEQWKKEIIHEFHVVAENLRVDFQGIFKDRLAQHEERITRLERYAGLMK